MRSSKEFSPPVELAKHVTEMCGAQGLRWLASLPSLIDEYESKWSITVGEAFTMAEFNFVAPAEGHSTGPTVIKIAPPFDNNEIRTEAAYLRNLAGRGCVRLVEEDPERRAILVERAVPGVNFADEYTDREIASITPAIDVLRRVHTEPPANDDDVILLEEWFDNLRRSDGTAFPASYAIRALDIYEHLAGREKNAYLHGDLHPANIVTAAREPFLLIDPKGIVGPIGYEIAVFLNNFHWWQGERSDVKLRLRSAVEQFSSAFGISEQELREWAYAQMVLSAWWMFDEMPALYDNEVVKADIWDV
jgi:streptomycin 6-kinase